MDVYDWAQEGPEPPEVWIRVICRHCSAPLFHPFGTSLSVATCEACFRDQSPDEETG